MGLITILMLMGILQNDRQMIVSEMMNVFIDIFVGRLPEYLRNSLVKCAMAA